jgi:carbonic anhydrase/acetyltransferase-like protein (isoleucine patch superfamily)
VTLLRLPGREPSVAASSFIAKSADVIGDVRIGANASVWYGAVVRGDVSPITIGDGTNVQDGAVLHATTGRTSLHVGRNVTIGHRAILHGCTVHDGALIGMGAIVLDDAIVETGAMVGAGALVTSGTTIPAHTLAVGSPARCVRELTEAERQQLALSAPHYIEAASAHRSAEEVGQ